MNKALASVESSSGEKPLVRSRARRRSLRRRLGRWTRRVEFYPRLEFAAAALTIILGWSSYAILTGGGAPGNGVSPPLVTLLLVANLIPVMVLVVLIGRRVAILLANRRRGLAGAQLHVRMVALFAGVAAVPTILVVIFASLLFQFGVQFWFSDRVTTVLASSNQVAQAYVEENRQRVSDDIAAMATDVNVYARDFGTNSDLFTKGLQFQIIARNLTEAVVFIKKPDGGLEELATSGLDTVALEKRLAGVDLSRTNGGAATVVATGGDRIEAVVSLDPKGDRYIYISRKVDPAVLARADRAAGALDEYRSLIERSRTMQLRFNLILVAVSLLTLAVAIWFALWLANRLVAPIARLALAAERVGQGDLDARVPVRGAPDEIGTLSRAFNRMTSQLKTQQNALMGANKQLEQRREFTEAVLSGVSAGVLSISADGIIRVANRSAEALLELPASALVGHPLSMALPDLAALLDEAQHSGNAVGEVRILRGTDTQTLSVRIAGETGADGGYVLTFDDITSQLSDQRRAAWADVARRIAHEIKNPLTPIQLAAERLQRKFGRQIADDAEVFAILTGTIVRQVGDLRRMVDEFSDFARLPKPVFAAENIDTVVRQALVLQEVAFPTIDYTVTGTADALIVCDRQQLGRAFTNLLKNAGEAVVTRVERDQQNGAPPRKGAIGIAIVDDGESVAVTISDNGIGLPMESRERLTEPYVTTRARGTGLGLAIVKKIIEDHGGGLELGDTPGGGAWARARLSRELVADAMPDEPLKLSA